MDMNLTAAFMGSRYARLGLALLPVIIDIILNKQEGKNWPNMLKRHYGILPKNLEEKG